MAQRLTARGFCCLHEPSSPHEVDLTGRFVYFEKFAGLDEELLLSGHTVQLMVEGSILAYEAEEGDDMTGNELKAALSTAVDDQIENLSGQLTDDDVDAVEAAVDGIIDAARDNVESDTE